MTLLAAAHKAARAAMKAQTQDKSGNLLYSDFLGYYMKTLTVKQAQVEVKDINYLHLVGSVLACVFIAALFIPVMQLNIDESARFALMSCLLGFCCIPALTGLDTFQNTKTIEAFYYGE